MSDEVLLNLQNLWVRFPREQVEAVRGVSLQLHRGEVLAIVGESGSGKSVTARALLGLSGEHAEVTADAAEMLGEDVRAYSERDWKRFRGRRVGLVSQDALVALDPLRTVGAEVSEAALRHGLIERSAKSEYAATLLEQVNVPEPQERTKQYPHELSGGLRQRALIASGLSGEPELLILDEPTTALDVTTQARILELLARTKRERALAMLFISHDLTVVNALADRVVVMRQGVIVEQGPTREVLEQPQHPYTQRLLRSVPAGVPKGTRLLETAAERQPQTARVEAADADSPSFTAEVVLEGINLVKHYPRPGGGVRQAVDGVSFVLRRGTTLGIVGESGSGKTTVSRMALALTAPSSGEVRLFGEEWSSLPMRRRQLARREIQVIAQDPLSSFDPRYDVRRLLLEPLHLYFGGAKKSHEDRIVQLLTEVGLDPAIVDRRPLQLSGGQRQRLAIARALAPNPKILVCDEPVSALDVSVQAQVLDLLAELQEEHGLSMLFISHDLGVIQHVSDDVLVMKDGLVVEAGPAAQVFAEPSHPYTRELLSALPQIESSRG